MELRRTFAVVLDGIDAACPFCAAPAGAATLEEIRSFEGLQSRTVHRVTCRCGASGPSHADPLAAAAAWSRRTFSWARPEADPARRNPRGASPEPRPQGQTSKVDVSVISSKPLPGSLR
ncbi:MAG: hypothetical protein KDB94_13195 [Acidobacteria bacterium]|nr:hypothetical protein [Acidobacteriota bacterium]